MTGIEWYLRGVGMIIEVDIDADTGGVADAYSLLGLVPVFDAPVAPAPVSLRPCTPNPFNPRTTSHYTLAAPMAVSLTVFDCAGRGVCTLVRDDIVPAGAHDIVWDGANDTGRAMPSGAYFARLRSGEILQTQRMMLVR